MANSLEIFSRFMTVARNVDQETITRTTPCQDRKLYYRDNTCLHSVNIVVTVTHKGY